MSLQCEHGCASVSSCKGACQPAPLPKHNPRACKHCRDGYGLTGTDHWIVKSIVPARIDIVACKGFSA
jgi:hypothetical protein